MSVRTVREHGTRTKFVHDQCRCLPCRAANARYAQRLARDYVYGRRRLVDAGPARVHLAALRDAGVGTRRVGEVTGLGRTAICKVVSGETRRVHPENLARILAVGADDRAAGVPVDGTGTRRRLRALVAVGWSQTRLAGRLGWTVANLNRVVVDDDRSLQRPLRDAVRRLYDEVWDTAPPAVGPAERGAVGRATRYAAARGWAPPMAWDDDTIDDPAAVARGPVTSPVCRGGVDLDEVRHLAAGGAHIGEIARRLGVTVATLDRARQREAAS